MNEQNQNNSQFPDEVINNYAVISKQKNSSIISKLPKEKTHPLLFNSRISVSDNTKLITEIRKCYLISPKLNIHILINNYDTISNTIRIDPFGLVENSPRKARDGYTFFGYYQTDNVDNININDNCINIDVLVLPKDKIVEEKFKGRHFYIKFNPFDMKYYIRDLGRGYGTFMKIDQDILLKDNNLINIGNSFLVFTFDLNQIESSQRIKLFNDSNNITVTVFSEKDTRRQKVFSSKENKKIFIGRDEKCNVAIKDSLLSRVHCVVLFEDKVGWILKDGRPGKGELDWKESTNGTWLFLMEETIVNDGMVFKGNQILYECKYVNSQYS